MKVCDVETTHSIEEAAMVLYQPCIDGSQWCYINPAQMALKMLNVGIIAGKLTMDT